MHESMTYEDLTSVNPRPKNMKRKLKDLTTNGVAIPLPATAFELNSNSGLS